MFWDTVEIPLQFISSTCNLSTLILFLYLSQCLLVLTIEVRSNSFFLFSNFIFLFFLYTKFQYRLFLSANVLKCYQFFFSNFPIHKVFSIQCSFVKFNKFIALDSFFFHSLNFICLLGSSCKICYNDFSIVQVKWKTYKHTKIAIA